VEPDTIVRQAAAELNVMMENGILRDYAVTYKLKGEYIIDITIQEKGKVLSVYMVSSDADDIKMQNLVKDVVKLVEFSFKLPKGRTQKFQHTFNFQ
jgi:predicted transport protein